MIAEVVRMFNTLLNYIKNLRARNFAAVLVVFLSSTTKQNPVMASASTVGELNSKPTTKPLIFVYLQGYNSCGRVEERPVRQFLEAASLNPNSKLYWGCYDGGHITHLDDTKEHFYLYTMNNRGQWSKGVEVEPQSGSLEIALKLHKDLKQFADTAAQAQREPEEADVFIAGHSHGGWMAMRLAYQMAFIKNAKLQQLLTIDPVSYDLCASSWFPLTVLYNTFNWFGEPSDCHRAPRDLEHINPTIAQTADGHWINIYEDSMPYLTSGPIEHADKNIRYEAPTHLDWVTAHRAIMHTDWTWSFFANRLAEIRGLPTQPIQDRPQFEAE